MNKKEKLRGQTKEFCHFDESAFEDRSIKFGVSGYEKPILELKANGDIFVKGKAVVNDIEVYWALKEFLLKAKEEL